MPEEIDTLAAAEADGEIELVKTSTELLDVTDPAVGIYEHMPLFDIYCGNLAAKVSTSLSDYLRYPVALTAQSPTIGKFDPICRPEGQPQFDRMYRYPSLGGIVAIVLPQGLIFRLVDILFGGRGELDSDEPDRALSAAESNMLDTLSNEIIAALTELLQVTTSLDAALEAKPWTHQQAAQVGRSESMVIIEFSFALGTHTSSFELWLSLSVLELLIGAKLLPSQDGTVPDPKWSEALAHQIFDCELELKCTLAKLSMPLNRVSRLGVGDFIPLGDVTTATVSIESLPVFKARVGVVNEQASASFLEWI